MPSSLLILLLPAALQALVMAVDEGWFHRRRGLPRWERLGHPLDTLTTAACFAWIVTVPNETEGALAIYVGLSAFSCLFITKDKLVHARLCTPAEHWLHALLFVLHPIVLLCFGWIWASGGHHWVLEGQLLLTVTFLTFQILYWSVYWEPHPAAKVR